MSLPRFLLLLLVPLAVAVVSVTAAIGADACGDDEARGRAAAFAERFLTYDPLDVADQVERIVALGDDEFASEFRRNAGEAFIEGVRTNQTTSTTRTLAGPTLQGCEGDSVVFAVLQVQVVERPGSPARFLRTPLEIRMRQVDGSWLVNEVAIL